MEMERPTTPATTTADVEAPMDTPAAADEEPTEPVPAPEPVPTVYSMRLPKRISYYSIGRFQHTYPWDPEQAAELIKTHRKEEEEEGPPDQPLLYASTDPDELTKYFCTHKLDGSNVHCVMFKVPDEPTEEEIEWMLTHTHSGIKGYRMVISKRYHYLPRKDTAFLNPDLLNVQLFLEQVRQLCRNVKARYEAVMGVPATTMRVYGELFGNKVGRPGQYILSQPQGFYPFDVTINHEDPEHAYLVAAAECCKLFHDAEFQYGCEPQYISSSNDLLELVEVCIAQLETKYSILGRDDEEDKYHEGFVIRHNRMKSWRFWYPMWTFKVLSQAYTRQKAVRNKAPTPKDEEARMNRLMRDPICKKFRKMYSDHLVDNAISKLGRHIHPNWKHFSNEVNRMVLEDLLLEMSPVPSPACLPSNWGHQWQEVQSMLLQKSPYKIKSKEDHHRMRGMVELLTRAYLLEAIEDICVPQGYEEWSEDTCGKVVNRLQRQLEQEVEGPDVIVEEEETVEYVCLQLEDEDLVVKDPADDE